MTVDREIEESSAGKTGPLLNKLHDVLKRLLSPPKDPVDDSPDWYGGLAVDPSSFSRQLIQLQTALRSHKPVPMEQKEQKPVESVRIEFGSESAV